MGNRLAVKLKDLGFAFREGKVLPSESLVKDFERRFSLNLPSDFRSFLVECGGMVGGASCTMKEPTPFGEEGYIDSFFGFQNDEIGTSTDIIDGAPDVIAIGSEPLGKMFWLFCEGPRAGNVLIHDHQGRSAWPDQQFYQWFPNLAPEIKHYLNLRQHGKLPKKARGFEHVYLAASSFTEFIEGLRPSD
jgi:hypothetical protein